MPRPDLDLCIHPLWREEDLGTPLPNSPHAVSVCLPLWRHVIGYEENDPAVRAALRAGYPRFVVPRQVEELARRARTTGAASLAFPSRACAERCAAYVFEKTGTRAEIEALSEGDRIHIVLVPESAFAAIKQYWQHFGEIVSTRQADAALAGRAAARGGGEAKRVLRERIAALAGAHAEDVFLYPTGMAAVAAGLRAGQALRPGAKTVQLGFPYVDVLKSQTATGPGAHFFPAADAEDIERAGELASREPLAGVICEFPGNPLLGGADLPRLRDLLRPQAAPLLIDDTTGTFYNIDALAFGDMVASSLTKTFSGVGDVMAGSLVLNTASPLYDRLSANVRAHYEDLLWDEDALVLEANSRDFAERMARINRTAECVCDALRSHPAVERVYYPKYEIPELYRQVQKPGGGYSGLFSLLLRDAPRTAPTFFDRLRVSKGPSLGNNFTLACPYTLLAHFDELEWAESLGVSRYLVRVSIGLEDADDLIGRFEQALGG